MFRWWPVRLLPRNRARRCCTSRARNCDQTRYIWAKLRSKRWFTLQVHMKSGALPIFRVFRYQILIPNFGPMSRLAHEKLTSACGRVGCSVIFDRNPEKICIRTHSRRTTMEPVCSPPEDPGVTHSATLLATSDRPKLTRLQRAERVASASARGCSAC